MAIFIIKKKGKKIELDLPPVIGISGLARCGKDTFSSFLIKKLSYIGVPSIQLSLADPIKRALDSTLKKDFGISAFTNNNEEKEFIRPLLVTYGTTLGRKKDENFWINKLEPKIQKNLERGFITVISDVRHVNEAEWIQKKGGYVIHITRIGQKPTNLQERYHNPLVKKIANYKFKWMDFLKAEDEDYMKRKISDQINAIFVKNKWSTYGKFDWSWGKKKEEKTFDILPPLPVLSS